jgi:hypothetical protein
LGGQPHVPPVPQVAHPVRPVLRPVHWGVERCVGVWEHDGWAATPAAGACPMPEPQQPPQEQPQEQQQQGEQEQQQQQQATAVSLPGGSGLRHVASRAGDEWQRNCGCLRTWAMHPCHLMQAPLTLATSRPRTDTRGSSTRHWSAWRALGSQACTRALQGGAQRVARHQRQQSL